MTEKIVTTSIRIPQEMVDRIDAMIEQHGHFKSKPAYIAYAMESLFRTLVYTKINMNKQLEEIRKISPVFDPMTITSLSNTLFSQYMEKYQSYNGPMCQILLHVPERLLKDIEECAQVLGYYTKVPEFIRIAIVDQLKNDEDLYEKVKRIKDNRIEQQKSAEEMIQSALTDMPKEQSALSGLTDLVDFILNQTRKD